jgi:two-component system cell cycle sensor histidine kinase/response regulator CckA
MRPEKMEALLERNQELQARLDEAEETLRAIRNGEVDAVVAAGPDGDAVYTLRGADEGYRLLVEQMAEGAMTLTEDGLVLFANDQLGRILGLPAEQVIGHPVHDFVPPESRGALDALLSAGDRAKFELKLKRTDGVSLPVYLSAGRLQSDGIACIALVVTDLSEQKRNEEIVTAGRLARSILEQAATAILVVDSEGRIIQANQASERLALQPVLLKAFSSVFPLSSGSEERGLAFDELFSTAKLHGSISGLAALLPRASGEAVDVVLNAGLLGGTDAEVLGCIITLSDISELKRVEAALRQSEAEQRRQREFLETLLFNAPYGLAVLTGPDLRYKLVNPAYQAMVGADIQLAERPYAEVFPEAAAVGAEAQLKRVIETGETWHMQSYRAPIPGKPTAAWEGRVVRLPLIEGEEPASLAFVWDVTDRTEAEEALQKHREWLRVTLGSIGDAVLATDTAGRITFLNKVAAGITAWPEEEAIGRHYREIFRTINEQTRQETEDIVNHVLAEGRSVLLANHTALVDRGGREVPIEDSAAPIKDAEGKVIGVVLVFHDVTAKRRARQALSESERRFRSLFENSIDAVFLTIPDGRIVAANPAACSLFGMTEEEICHVGRSGLVDPGDERQVSLVDERQAAGRAQGELTYIRKDGSRFPGETSSAVVGEGQAFVIIRDITERKRAEEALRQSNQQLEKRVAERTAELASANDKVRAERQRFLDMLDTLPVVVNIIRSDHRIEWANRSYRESFGNNVGRLCYESQFCREQPCAECQAFTPLKTGQSHRWEWTLPSGRTFDIHNFPFASEDGSPAILEMDLDITEIRRAEQVLKNSNTMLEQIVAERTSELRENEQRLRVLGDNLPDSTVYQYVHELDGTQRFLYCSAGVERLNGVKPSEVLGDSGVLHRQVPPEYLERVVQEEARSKRDLSDFKMEVPMRRPDGEVRWMRLQSRPRRLPDGRTAWDGVQTDITEQKKAEDRLRQAQKLESIGLLAAGIAHDFNNILTGVMGNASLLMEDAPSDQVETLEAIVSSTERAAHLTKQLLAYSGKGQFIVRDLDITQAVNEIADLVQFSIPKSVSVNLNLERRLPLVSMDPGQLQQILMNLVINAGEAIGDGDSGRITVTTWLADVKAAFTDELSEEVGAGRYVCVEVRDTGPGIDPEKKAKIFDPFFTTKFVGRGLGLAAVAGILRTLKGGVLVHSTPGEGTTFTVFLPVAAQRALAVQEAASGKVRASVLVVDDEVAVRKFISSVLRKKGYHVVQASDGREALSVCGSFPGAISAAIVDVVMPNMGANEFLPALKAREPGMRILLTSGYSEAEARRLCSDYPGAGFIQKPYTAQQLANAVKDLIADAV